MQLAGPQSVAATCAVVRSCMVQLPGAIVWVSCHGCLMLCLPGHCLVFLFSVWVMWRVCACGRAGPEPLHTIPWHLDCRDHIIPGASTIVVILPCDKNVAMIIAKVNIGFV
jgi:hypothetical protein